MGNPRGFLQVRRSKGERRPIAERLHDDRELEIAPSEAALREQASRCMDCGIPFCHSGCPLGNLIPDWNDLVYEGRFDEAIAELDATNNFPEITGRVCPAPCEASCVINLENAPVTIKTIERAIADRALAAGLAPKRAARATGKKVAIIGSGPAGLAAAQELARAGHEVVVFERADRPGGLLRYGIPDFKLEKHVLEQRLDQLRAEGVVFRAGVDVGVDIKGDELRAEFDAIVLACGARKPRELSVPGRELTGIELAMRFLEQHNRRVAGDAIDPKEELVATGKHVIVIGGGDTGSDCVGTSLRQGAKSVTSLELMPEPPHERRPENPWPAWPLILRTSSSHEEGGERRFAVSTERFLGEGGHVKALVTHQVRLEGGRVVPIDGTRQELSADLVLLAMGFVGPGLESGAPLPILAQLGVALDARGNVAAKDGATSVPGVFAAGDVARGQSLVVWAIAEGRRVARAVSDSLRNGSTPT